MQAQLLHAQADGGARRELPRADAHERLGDAAMRKEQPERAKEEEYDVRLLLHAMPAHSCLTTAASPTGAPRRWLLVMAHSLLRYCIFFTVFNN